MRREVTTNIDDVVCFRPSRVEGVANVDEVCISRESLEIVSVDKRISGASKKSSEEAASNCMRKDRRR